MARFWEDVVTHLTPSIEGGERAEEVREMRRECARLESLFWNFLRDDKDHPLTRALVAEACAAPVLGSSLPARWVRRTDAFFEERRQLLRSAERRAREAANDKWFDDGLAWIRRAYSHGEIPQGRTTIGYTFEILRMRRHPHWRPNFPWRGEDGDILKGFYKERGYPVVVDVPDDEIYGS